MSSKLKKVWFLILESIRRFNEDNAIYYSASLSYFTIFSLPPVIIIIIYITSNLLGNREVSDDIYLEFTKLLGKEAANQIEEMVERAHKSSATRFAKILGIGTLLFASTSTFVAIQSALNNIWKVRINPKNNLVKLVKDRFLSFTLIVTMAFLLLVSLVVHGLLMAITKFFSELLDSYTIYLIEVVNLVVPLIVVSLLFAMVYKFLPDVKIKWKDVWVGSLVTGILFTIGKYLFSFYIGSTNVFSTYGAAGTIILILVWIFYSSIILFLGAEFTHVYAETYGSGINPSAFAHKIESVIVDEQKDKDG